MDTRFIFLLFSSFRWGKGSRKTSLPGNALVEGLERSTHVEMLKLEYESGLDGLQLRRYDRQNRDFDAIEFVHTAPGPTLA